MKTTALLLLFPFLALSQTPPPPAPATPPKAVPKAAPAAPRTQAAPRAAQPQPQPRYTPPPAAPRTVQQPQPRYTPPPAAPRTVQQPQPRYTPPAAQPRYTPPPAAGQPRYTPPAAAPRSLYAPRAIPPVNVMARTRNGITLTRDFVVAHPHGIFSREIHPLAYSPAFVLRVNTEPPPFRASAYIASPGVGYVWIPGYWFWADGQYMWIEGMWTAPPVDGAQWVSPAWSLQDDATWALEEGYWMDPEAQSDDSQQQIEQPPVQQAAAEPVQAEPIQESSNPVPPGEFSKPWITNSQVVLEPFASVWYSANFGAESGWHMVGDFSTSSPAGVIVSIDNGKEKGRKTTRFWSTGVAQTSGTFDVPVVDAGRYFLYFNNPSDQRVYVNVNTAFTYRQ